MKLYSVKINYISNEDYVIPESLLEFNIHSTNIEEARQKALSNLRFHMLDENDFYVVEQSTNYCEISFVDAHTGQDVSYTITETFT